MPVGSVDGTSAKGKADLLVERMHAESSILVDEIHNRAVLHPFDRRRTSGVLVPKDRRKLLTEALMGLRSQCPSAGVGPLDSEAESVVRLRRRTARGERNQVLHLVHHDSMRDEVATEVNVRLAVRQKHDALLIALLLDASVPEDAGSPDELFLGERGHADGILPGLLSEGDEDADPLAHVYVDSLEGSAGIPWRGSEAYLDFLRMHEITICSYDPHVVLVNRDAEFVVSTRVDEVQPDVFLSFLGFHDLQVRKRINALALVHVCHAGVRRQASAGITVDAVIRLCDDLRVQADCAASAVHDQRSRAGRRGAGVAVHQHEDVHAVVVPVRHHQVVDLLLCREHGRDVRLFVRDQAVGSFPPWCGFDEERSSLSLSYVSSFRTASCKLAHICKRWAKVAMVEVDAGLVCQGELVGVGVPWFDGVLCDSRDTVHPVFVVLVHTVPASCQYRWRFP